MVLEKVYSNNSVTHTWPAAFSKPLANSASATYVAYVEGSETFSMKFENDDFQSWLISFQGSIESISRLPRLALPDLSKHNKSRRYHIATVDMTKCKKVMQWMRGKFLYFRIFHVKKKHVRISSDFMPQAV